MTSRRRTWTWQHQKGEEQQPPRQRLETFALQRGYTHEAIAARLKLRKEQENGSWHGLRYYQ
ncbi:hypothetical protein Ahy_B02g057413 isoform F [Arachis hypogaea]|uniref:Uncharacterized protein n=1 Tax=Arachis hypogaea TaxID=3818 RepID=A0A445AC66_ARAHY|nr:hypothetical protein Ahy_B02g057413 isoform F [Arachis hypogaea]